MKNHNTDNNNNKKIFKCDDTGIQFLYNDLENVSFIHTGKEFFRKSKNKIYPLLNIETFEQIESQDVLQEHLIEDFQEGFLKIYRPFQTLFTISIINEELVQYIKLNLN